MDYSRRKFLKTILLGTGGVLASPFSFPLFSNIIQPVDTKSAILEQKRNALRAFYLREYDKAEELYKNLILKCPSDITCYDGLINIYNKHSKYIDAIELLEKGLSKNKSSPVFYERLARSLIKLSLGNLKQESEYIIRSGNDFLIKRSINLYLDAINIQPDKKYLREGLLDALKSLSKKNQILQKKNLPVLKLDLATEQNVTRESSAYKEVWERTRNSEKNNLHKLNENKLSNLLDKCKKKKRREIYFEDERQLREDSIREFNGKCYRALLIKSIHAKNIESATQCYGLLKQNTPKDSFSKGKIVHFYNRISAYDSLESLYELEVSEKDHSVWSEISLARTFIKQNRNTAQSKEILNNIKNTFYSEQSKLQGAIAFNLAELNFRANDYNSGRQNLMEAMNALLVGGVVNSLVISYAISFLKEGEYLKAKNILLRYTGDDKVKCNSEIDTVIKRAQAFKKEKRREAIKNNGMLKNAYADEELASRESLGAYYALAKTYKRMGDSRGLVEVMNTIRKIDPDDKFLKNNK